jgi:hypothetical protein
MSLWGERTMLLLAAVLVMLYSCQSNAADYHVWDLKEFTINYRNYALINDQARNALIYPIHPKEGIDVGFKSDVLGFGYFDNEIMSLTSDSQYEAIGLDLRLGIRVSDYVQVGYWHRSEHLLDHHSDYLPRYPSQDALEVRIYLFRSKSPRESLL